MMPLMAEYPRIVVMAMVALEMRLGTLSGIITSVMICMGEAPRL